jgi:hypothetical protein
LDTILEKQSDSKILGNNPSLVYQLLRTLIHLINSLLDERLSIWVEVVGPASSESSSSSLKNIEKQLEIK